MKFIKKLFQAFGIEGGEMTIAPAHETKKKALKDLKAYDSYGSEPLGILLVDHVSHEGQEYFIPSIQNRSTPPLVLQRWKELRINPALDPKPDAYETTIYADQVGFCTHPWDGTDEIAAHEATRVYVAADGIFDRQGDLCTVHSHQGGYNLDEYLYLVKNPLLSLVGKPMYLRADQSGDFLSDSVHGPMCLPGTDGTLPEHYLEAAKMHWQVVARYGSKKHPEALLSKSTHWSWDPQNRLSGMSLVEEYMPGNEIDRAFDPNPAHRSTAQQLAAYMSMVYDGHCGQFKGVGIKDADPNMVVVFPCLSNFDIDYLHEIIEWCRTNRPDGKLAWDKMAFNYYCSKKNKGYKIHLGEPCSPQDCNLEPLAEEVIIYCNYEMPGMDVYVTETGYDLMLEGEDPTEHALPDAETVTKYTTDTIKILLNAGFDKVFIYQLKDPKEEAFLYRRSGAYANWQDGSKIKNPSLIAWVNDLPSIV